MGEDFCHDAKCSSSVLDLMGDTRILELGKKNQGKARIYAKAELMNPGGSLKDRLVRYVNEAAEKPGSDANVVIMFQDTGQRYLDDICWNV